MSFEVTILRNLLNNKEYLDIVAPFLKDEYFDNNINKFLYKEIDKFIKEYKTPPSKEALVHIINDKKNINEETYKKLLKRITIVTKTKDNEKNLDWLVSETEKYCQERAVYNAVLSSISILDGEDKKHDKTAIPSILSDALGVSFDLNLGHDYKSDAENRYEYYTAKNKHYPCGLYHLDRITGGGVIAKTLNSVMADTGVGKSIFLCHLATCYMKRGHNVLYITLEMREEELAKRIDANLLGIPISSLDKISKEDYISKVSEVKNRFKGNIKFKEYQSGTAHAGHFRQLIKELEMKDDYNVDILMVDYMSICASERLKNVGGMRYDLYLQFISEELRNLGKEFDIPVWTAQQSNREGSNNLDSGKTNIADSYATLRTLDLFLSLMINDELEERGQVLCKQLKNRYGKTFNPKKFVLGRDTDYMRFYDIDTPVIDTSVNENNNSLNKKQTKKKISGFKFK